MSKPIFRRLKLYARTCIPRVMWSVVERDGQPELVIWREWFGSAYGIVSLAGNWGRWDRHRIADESSRDPLPASLSGGTVE